MQQIKPDYFIRMYNSITNGRSNSSSSSSGIDAAYIDFLELVSFFLAMYYRYLLASALREMEINEDLTEAPRDCNTSGAVWETGKTYFK